MNSLQNTDRMEDQQFNYNTYDQEEIIDSFKADVKDFDLQTIFEVIFKKLHPLFSIDCGSVTLYDAELSKIIKTYVSESSKPGAVKCSEIFSPPIPLCKLKAEVAAFEFPILRSRDNWIQDFGKNHSPHDLSHDYLYHCYIPLEIDNKILGTLALHNHKKELSPEGLMFCCNIADLLAELIHRMNKTPNRAVVNPGGGDNNLLLSMIKKQEQEIKEYKEQLESVLLHLPEEVQVSNNYDDIVGKGKEMQQVFNLLTNVSDSEATVLILGETGTGKELIAKAIHNDSARKDRVMVKVNCAAIPPNLIESELFGHEKGSFTGATERRIGKFELANKSTLFLDEIGELSLELQVKLLRVLQEKEFERVGGKTTIATDVRIVSATNRNLLEEVEAGRFRSDLFYRLNVFPVSLPPLRKRKEDIPLLAGHFLSRFTQKSGKKIDGFSQKALSDMMKYHWPGNVRELEHLIERQVLLTKGTMIKELEIPSENKAMAIDGAEIVPVKTILENERDHIFAVLKMCNGKISGKDGAARLLAVPATTLNSKIKKLGLSRKHIL